MKEITIMPVKVQNGNKEIEVFESEGGFCMTTEFLGRCIGYPDPRRHMSRLFRRHKDVLEPHQFVLTSDDKLGRGRRSYFYDAKGCVKAVGFANTPQAREFLPRLVDYLDYLETKRIIQIEKYWFSRRPFWPEIRDRVTRGEPFRVIAEIMGRSAASVRNAVRRMIEVGILQPLRAALALTGTAKKTVLRYGIGWGQEKPVQPSLFDEAQPT